MLLLLKLQSEKKNKKKHQEQNHNGPGTLKMINDDLHTIYKLLLFSIINNNSLFHRLNVWWKDIHCIVFSFWALIINRCTPAFIWMAVNWRKSENNKKIFLNDVNLLLWCWRTRFGGRGREREREEKIHFIFSFNKMLFTVRLLSPVRKSLQLYWVPQSI